MHGHTTSHENLQLALIGHSTNPSGTEQPFPPCREYLPGHRYADFPAHQHDLGVYPINPTGIGGLSEHRQEWVLWPTSCNEPLRDGYPRTWPVSSSWSRDLSRRVSAHHVVFASPNPPTHHVLTGNVTNLNVSVPLASSTARQGQAAGQSQQFVSQHWRKIIIGIHR